MKWKPPGVRLQLNDAVPFVVEDEQLRRHAALVQFCEDLLRFAQGRTRIILTVSDRQRALLPRAHTCVGIA